MKALPKLGSSSAGKGRAVAKRSLADRLAPVVPEQAAKPTGSRPRGGGPRNVPFQMMLPEETHQALRLASITRKTSVRVLILEALKAAGWDVPADELVDRRRG